MYTNYKQLLLQTRFAKITNKKVIAKILCEKHNKSSLEGAQSQFIKLGPKTSWSK